MNWSPRFKVGDVIKTKPGGECRSVTGDKVEAGKLYTVVKLDQGGWPILHTDRHDGEGWNPHSFELVEPAPEPVDPSPSLQPGELKEGDRVLHAVRGYGKLYSIDRENGVGLVLFEGTSIVELDKYICVALNLLTKIEDEKPKTLEKQLRECAEDWIRFDSKDEPYLPEQGGEQLVQVFTEHIRSKRAEIMSVVSEVGHLPAETYARLRSLLLDSEQ